jgi:ribose 5-phosphate isomerase B
VRITLASDHAGYRLKSFLVRHLGEQGHDVTDLGTDSEAPVDYPAFCAAAARAVVGGDADVGIVLGGSGQGEAMAANKVHGARAALCHDELTARLARQHNDANLLSLGGRLVTETVATGIVATFLTTPFEGGRHVARLEQLRSIEEQESAR